MCIEKEIEEKIEERVEDLLEHDEDLQKAIHEMAEDKINEIKKTRKKNSFWRNAEGKLSGQKIFTNIVLIKMMLFSFGFLAKDLHHAVPLNEMHLILILVTSFLAMIYKHMSNRFFKNLSNFKIGRDGLEVNLRDDNNGENKEDDNTEHN